MILSSINSLAFFSEEYTNARRSHPIPQLTCKGKICDSYQPEAVHCVNIGGDGVDVNWKVIGQLLSVYSLLIAAFVVDSARRTYPVA